MWGALPAVSRGTPNRTVTSNWRDQCEHPAQLGQRRAAADVLQHKLIPRAAERLPAVDVGRVALTRHPAAATAGNLYRSAPGPRTVTGGRHGRRQERRRSAAAVATLATTAVRLARRRSQS